MITDNNTDMYVSKTNFDRAFGCIRSVPEADIVRDFAITH